MKMQEKQNNSQLDDFSKILSEKLKYHKMAVDDECWNDINRQIQPKKRPQIWWFVAAVAAIALLVVMVIPTQENASKLSENKWLVPKNNQPFTQKNESSYYGVNQTEKVADKLVLDKNKKSNHVVYITNSTIVIDSVSTSTITDFENAIVEKHEIKNTDSDSILKCIDNLFDPHFEELIVEIKEKKKERGWMLGALASSGSQVSQQNNSKNRIYLNNEPFKDFSTEPLTQNSVQNSLADPAEFSEIEHMPSLSFGLSVRKNINHRFGLETGIVYTYLSSKFKQNNLPVYKGKQELHYLGIPINLVVYLWDNPNWNVYLSSGVMAEKGLRQLYTQEKYNNDVRISSNVEKNEIKGIQWSINAAAGISYKLDKSWNIYFEPRYSYNFDNDQPISIRTDKKHTMGIQGGLRYMIH